MSSDLDLDADLLEVALLDRNQLGAVGDRARHADADGVFRRRGAGERHEAERRRQNRTQHGHEREPPGDAAANSGDPILKSWRRS